MIGLGLKLKSWAFVRLSKIADFAQGLAIFLHSTLIQLFFYLITKNA